MRVLNQAEQISQSSPNKNLEELLYIYDMKSITLNNLEDKDQSLKYAKASLDLRKEFQADDPFAIRISMNNLALSYILSDQFEKAAVIIEEMPLWINKIDSELNQAKSWAGYYNLKAFYHTSTKDDLLSVAFRQKAVDINNQNFETLSSQMIWLNRVLADAYFKSGQIDRSIQVYNEVEQLYLNQVTDNEARIYRVILDRLMIYLCSGNQAAVNEMKQLKALDFDQLNSSLLRVKTALVDAFYELEYGDQSSADQAVYHAQQVMAAEYDDKDSIYFSYLKLAEAMQLFNAKQKRAANAIIQELQAYWLEFPNSHIGLKLAVDRLENSIKDSK
jgi:hypothetical protein